MLVDFLKHALKIYFTFIWPCDFHNAENMEVILEFDNKKQKQL